MTASASGMMAFSAAASSLTSSTFSVALDLSFFGFSPPWIALLRLRFRPAKAFSFFSPLAGTAFSAVATAGVSASTDSTTSSGLAASVSFATTSSVLSASSVAFGSSLATFFSDALRRAPRPKKELRRFSVAAAAVVGLTGSSTLASPSVEATSATAAASGSTAFEVSGRTGATSAGASVAAGTTSSVFFSVVGLRAPLMRSMYLELRRDLSLLRSLGRVSFSSDETTAASAGSVVASVVAGPATIES
jgi:hypothetical protein